MTYATLDDMVTRFGQAELVQLTDETLQATAINYEVLERAIADADAQINARLQVRFKLPLQTVPLLLVNVACDIARYRLHAARAPDHVSKRYDDAIKQLEQVRKGELDLGLDALDATTVDVGGPDSFGGPRVFSGGLLSDYANGS
jgi:phage gp36-like protein